MASVIILDTTTQTPEIVSINIVNSQDYQAQSIVAISNTQVFYSYRETNANTHHLAIANFLEDTSTSWLNETSHKSIDEDSTLGSISRLSHDSATLWHAVNLGTFVTYFQFNSTDLTLLGSKQDGDNAITSSGLSMEVSQEVV